MKNLLLFLTVLVSTVLSMSAQTSQVATLSHDGSITTYYSANALKDAYEAAVDGDIITLSAGTFNTVTIEKNITIRGAGMNLESNPTILTGDTKIEPVVSSDYSLTLEGLRISKMSITADVNNLSVVKCYIGEYSNWQNNQNVENARYIHCVFGDSTEFNGSISFVNCVFTKFSSTTVYNVLTLNNCVLLEVGIAYSYYSPLNIYGCTLTNCFIYCSYSTHGILKGSNNNCINCVYVGGHTNPFQDGNINCIVAGNLNNSDIFTEDYHLKGDYASKWLGNDGKEIGIYGGSLPFDPTPSNPQITKFNVSPKTTADGKLSVDIEVKAN